MKPKLLNNILDLIFRAKETEQETEKRLLTQKANYSRLTREQYEKKLENNASCREKETEKRRSNRLETDRASHRISRMLNPKKEKDAQEKWKQRYKK